MTSVTVTVAVACCRRTDEAGSGDLYPDPDAAPLEVALQAAGAVTRPLAWDDRSVAWEEFSRVLISSTWDSVDRPAEYLAWVRDTGQRTRLINDPAFIEWSLDKRYLQDLDAAGVPVIPTAWVSDPGPWEPPRDSEFVVKPSISAGGRDTARYPPGDPAAIGHVSGLVAAGQTVMIQDYLATIDTEGELNAVFIGGTFSHAVTKKPALQLGQGVIERPWERMAWAGLATPSDDQMEVASAAMAVVRDRIGADPTYGRVDLIRGPGGRPLVLEVELIDPYLSLDWDAAGAGRLARAVLADG
jgi:glutathione synthase/RimK-type ligase-like ATP-grasp enzyme